MAKPGLLAHGGAVLAVVALAAAGIGASVWARKGARASILAKPKQREREATALRIYHSPEFQARLAKGKEQFAASPLADNSDAEAAIDRASEALAFSAALYSANYDAVRPYIMWGTHCGHRWMGHTALSCGYGLDSPDNIYRSATFDGAGHYLIRGIFHGAGPAQLSIVIYRGIPGVPGSMNAEGHMDELAGIASETIVRDADGNFMITIDADPANGRANHLQVPREESALHLMVRDSLDDWSRELPVELTMERLDPPSPALAQRSLKESIDLAGEILGYTIPFWLNWFESYVYAKPLNDVPTPWKRVQGWGMTQQGRFALKEGEAWVITVDPLDAKFFDFQISDPWTKAVEYVSKTGSFNTSQAEKNPDGTITLVASPVDPGVHNWLDTMGLHLGTYQVRWQGLPASVTSGDGSVRKVEVVKLAELAAHLPAGTRLVSNKERAAQLAARKKSYANRLR